MESFQLLISAILHCFIYDTIYMVADQRTEKNNFFTLDRYKKNSQKGL